jgi:UDP-glucose 4-epimerase
MSFNLVFHCFLNANHGDIFVQKSPSATILNLAIALKELTSCSSDIKIIGTRHGEKLYETLISREEMSRADDIGNYYRIPSDSRDLNYDNYFTKGLEKISDINDYTSHNTIQLNVSQIKDLLLKLDIVKDFLYEKT